MAKMNIIAFIIFLASCGQQSTTPPSETNGNKTPEQVTDTLAASDFVTNLKTSNFQEVGRTGIVMFPLSTGTPERSGGSFSLYKGSPAGTYWNVVFLNMHTGESRLLGENKMLVTGITPYSETVGMDMPDSIGRYIFYTVKTNDVNKDGKLDDKDPEYLFISALDGTGFRQLSPEGYHVKNWQTVWSANKIIMVVTRDSNKDGEFSNEDDEWVFGIDPSNDKAPREVFSQALKGKMKMLHDRDWKKKQN